MSDFKKEFSGEEIDLARHEMIRLGKEVQNLIVEFHKNSEIPRVGILAGYMALRMNVNSYANAIRANLGDELKEHMIEIADHMMREIFTKTETRKL